MTLNGVMALIFSLFRRIRVRSFVVKQLLGLPRFRNLLLIVYMTILIRSAQLFNDYLCKTISDNSV